MTDLPSGVVYYSDYLDISSQRELLDEVRSGVNHSPFFVPTMPRTGKALSVRMTNFGNLGWISDRSGYRYESCHPETGNEWHPIPDILLNIWRDVCPDHPLPDACLVNHYSVGSKMGLHVDSDEETFLVPVVSVSLGDDCLFRVGGVERKGETYSLRLRSGDVIILSGASRLAYHGVSRIYAGTSDLLDSPGRINLTLRRVRA